MTVAIALPRPRDLMALEKARKMIAEARTMGEVKDIRDQGHAAIRYAKSRRDIGLETQNDAAEIVLLAERRLGGMLAGMEKNKGTAVPTRSHDVTTLTDLGISKMQSHRWQLEANVSEEDFERFILESRESGKQLTSGAVVKLGKQNSHRKQWATVAEPLEGTCRNLLELIETGQKFSCIYADPPWAYDNQQTRAATDNHYSTMSVEAICAEPVRELIADNAHLHLWTTNAFGHDAMRVMEAWGFEYRSCFVWCKNQMGIGNYWRLAHEFLLLGIRGKATNFLANDQISWIATDRTKHSCKPREVRKRIEKVSPGPYLEMYGREAIEGWTVYGDQVERTIFDD